MELVVLVDEQNNPIGTADKDTVHTADTPLHRAFSLFLFNSKGQLLVTQRAFHKKAFPGMWTNTVCGHLLPDETSIMAATRRLKDELGITGVSPKEAAPYRYRFADKNGIVENEICPILIGNYNGVPKPNSSEVAAWKWVDWKEFLKNSKDPNSGYSPWSIEEAQILVTLKLPQINQEQQ